MDGIHPVVFCRNPRLAAVVNIANLAAAAYQDADLNEQFREVKKKVISTGEVRRENTNVQMASIIELYRR